MHQKQNKMRDDLYVYVEAVKVVSRVLLPVVLPCYTTTDRPFVQAVVTFLEDRKVTESFISCEEERRRLEMEIEMETDACLWDGMLHM